jgi:osmoprotectant transport system permease protein
MSEELYYLLLKLPEYLGGHILLSMAALGVGLMVSIPLGVLASRRPRLSEYVLGTAGILQTVPTLALLALMVPLLGGMIGFVPAFIALTLYSILPILANTITGIRGIDPSVTEAARGLGMNDWQMLGRVQLPLAAPVIISGIRTATVLVVGTATLALPVGGLSLGNYIFSGLSMNNITATIFGCIFTALLAILMDQLVHLLELAVQRRSRRLAWCAAAGFAIVLLVGSYSPITQAFAAPPRVVASAPFTEQYILSEVMKDRLESAGFRVDQRQGMGETIQFYALQRGKIDCCVNYTGNIWVTLMHKKDAADAKTTYEETVRFMKEKYDVECLGKLGFENAYVLAMREDRAAMLGINTIEDLARHQRKFIIAGDEQFFDRPEWRWVGEKYQLSFKEIKQMDPGLIYGAIKDDQVQVICAYSSDGRIAANKLRVLRDPKKVLPPYDAILLLSRRGSENAPLKEALRALVGNVDPALMQQANLRVDVDEQSPRVAARELQAALLRK